MSRVARALAGRLLARDSTNPLAGVAGASSILMAAGTFDDAKLV